MSSVDLAWFTGEHGQQVEPQQAPAPPPARPKARPASAKRSMPEATKRAIDDIHARYPGGLDDELPSDL